MEHPPAPKDRWLLLIHQIPPKPNYLRVKIGRRLQRLGAVAIKNSVYCLPKNDQTYEDFQWVVREIVESKGEASVVEASFVEGISNEQVEAMFQTARAADYSALNEDAQQLRAELANGKAVAVELSRLRKRLTELVEIDFFGANGREAAEALVAQLEEQMETPTETRHPRSPPHQVGTGRTWITRKGIKVDRMASAWLIKNFIDEQACFKFVPGQGYYPLPGELRFDMFEAEYTHEGDRCTFEVLLERFGLNDPALHQMGEIVHDIDLKDGKFGRQEAAGLDCLITGLTSANTDDEARLAQGAPLFANFYEYFRRNKP